MTTTIKTTNFNVEIVLIYERMQTNLQLIVANLNVNDRFN